MSKMAELAYDIEQYYIDGLSPKTIAALLGCPVRMVYDWIYENGLESTVSTVVESATVDILANP